MMQIMIDIPEEYYETLRKIDAIVRGQRSCKTLMSIMLNAVANGIPFPKNHGRIADMDEAIKCIKEVEGEDAIWAISLIEWACGKRTLIEADKAESEGKE